MNRTLRHPSAVFLSLIKKITGWQDKPQDCADDHHQAEIPALRFMAKMLPAQMNPDKPAQ